MDSPPVEKSWVPLTAHERRVVGVLVEKAKTTPEYYPLTVAAIVTGSNQKSNRDPITNFDADDVEEILQNLRKKGAVVKVEGSGRVVRWKHTMYEWLKVNKVELAVMAELMLRGAQSVGDLRARASRMEPLADLAALQAVLDTLIAKDLVVTLTPPSVRRGVVVTHNLGRADDLDRDRAKYANVVDGADESDAPAARPAPRAERPAPAPAGPGPEVLALRAELDALKDLVDRLAAEVQELKSALGA